MNIEIDFEKDNYISGESISFYLNFSNEENLPSISHLTFFVF